MMFTAIKHALVRLAFYPSLLYSRTLIRLGLRHQWDWVDEHVLLGALPRKRHIPELATMGVRAIINTCREFPGHHEALSSCHMTQLHIPTLDFHPPTLDDVVLCLHFIDEQVRNHQKVYVHCKAGRGRSATIALCYLIARKQMSAAKAYRHLKSIRAEVDNKLDRRQVVKEIEKQMQEGRWLPPPGVCTS